MSLLLLILGLILFIGLVVVHEFGHFIMARRNGVGVEEFGIFFPPRLYKRRMKGGWNFTINAIPLGGFVKLKGEHDSDTEPGSFGAATLPVKSKIMAAGVVMNLLTALVLFTILALVGTPKLLPNQFAVKSDTHVVNRRVLITSVEPNSPAAKAGLKSRDSIKAIGIPGQSPVFITSGDNLPKITQHFAGQTVDINYIRDGHQHVAKTVLLSAATVTQSLATYNQRIAQTKLDCASIPPPKGYLGITKQDYAVQRSTWSAPVAAVGLSGQITALTFQGLGHAVGGLGSLVAGAVTGDSTARKNGQCAAASQVGGPVAIFVTLRDGSSLGILYVLFIIAIISLTLAIMNILPIPALDGGRLWITLVARGLKRPLSAKREEAINAAGFMVLISLIIVITIVDVKRFF